MYRLHYDSFPCYLWADYLHFQDIFSAPDILPVSIDCESCASGTPGMDTTSMPSTLIHMAPGTEVPKPPASLDSVYAVVPHCSANEGYDSNDETMLTLMTVEDSSDGEF